MKRTKYYRPANRDYMKKRNEWLFPTAMVIFAVGMLAAVSAKACDEVYLKLGAGYKLQSEILINHQGQEYHFVDESHPVSFRGEIGCQSGRFTYGVSKYSQWFQGWPVDNKDESSRVEVFIDVKFSIWGS